ncbi:hypothetical protein J3A83DRAFT_4363418 [Scleroderma citrinum]
MFTWQPPHMHGDASHSCQSQNSKPPRHQLCFTPLAAWTADLPKQLMITCVSKSASPITEATYRQFGDAHHSLPHMGKLTLNHITKITQMVDLWNLNAFLKKAKTLQLNGVHLPFWRNWLFTNPSIFLLPEILHACHKFFFDHVLLWCKELVSSELDTQYKCHHKCIGLCNGDS